MKHPVKREENRQKEPRRPAPPGKRVRLAEGELEDGPLDAIRYVPTPIPSAPTPANVTASATLVVEVSLAELFAA